MWCVCVSVDPAAVGPYAEELGLAKPPVHGETSRSVRAFLAGDGVAKSKVAVAGRGVCDSASSWSWCVVVSLLRKTRSAGLSG